MPFLIAHHRSLLKLGPERGHFFGSDFSNLPPLWRQGALGEAEASGRILPTLFFIGYFADGSANAPALEFFRYHEAPKFPAAKPRPRPRRAIRDLLLYGLCGGLLITVLKLTEYRFLVLEHSVELYGGLIAATFAGLGIQRAKSPEGMTTIPHGSPHNRGVQTRSWLRGE